MIGAMSTTPAGSAAGRPLPFELRMALRYLTTRRREGPVTLVTVLCSAGVLVGVAALVLGLALTTGLHGDVRARLLANNPHVVVGPPWGRGSLTAEEAEAIAAAALAVPGVVAAAPATEMAALVSSGKVPAGLPVVVRAVDPGRE